MGARKHGARDTGAVGGGVSGRSRALGAVGDGIECIVPDADSEYLKRYLDIDVDGRALHCLVYEINPERVRGMQPMGHVDWILFHPE